MRNTWCKGAGAIDCRGGVGELTTTTRAARCLCEQSSSGEEGEDSASDEAELEGCVVNDRCGLNDVITHYSDHPIRSTRVVVYRL